MRTATVARTVGIGLAAMLALSACGGGQSTTHPVSGLHSPAARDDASKRAAAWAHEWNTASDAGDASASVGSRKSSGAVEMAPSAGRGAAYDSAGDVVTSPAPDVAPNAPVDPALSAGSVDDNEKWDDYLNYRQGMLRTGIKVHDVDITTRETVHVVDRDNKPVLGAHVELRDGATVVQTRTTYSDGRVLFFPPPSTGQDTAPKYTISVTLGDTHIEQPLDRESHDHTIKLDVSASHADPVPLDVVFLIDATGSMGDEIEQLKANMVSVAEQVNKLSPRPDVRFGMTVFRDRGDAFVTRNFDLTNDVNSFVTAMRAVVADGGGDTPESVNAGLHDALNAQHWRGDDAVKLVFLVGDAAPHLDYDHDFDYSQEMQVAAARGIKIEPIASSGLDDQGEFIFRQLAQYTTGRFSFLTYGADGHSPGTSTPHHVDDYAVLSLDELVVKLIGDELAPR